MNSTRKPTDSNQIILQWLTYALWGWTLVSLSVMIGAILASYVAKTDVGSTGAFGLAALLVLLPIAFTCDYYYSKREPMRKVGGAQFVMIVHAVIFALLAISSLMTAVFSVVQLLISSTDSADTLTTLYTSFIITLLCIITFVRVINPPQYPWVQLSYRSVMLAATGIIGLFGIIGPIAQQHKIRNDKLIVAELANLADAVNNYADNKGNLPNTLADVDVSSDTKKLVDKNIVTFEKVGKHEPQPSYQGAYTKAGFKYALCVNFAKEDKGSYYDGGNLYPGDEYRTYLDLYSHPKGAVCYRMTTADY